MKPSASKRSRGIVSATFIATAFATLPTLKTPLAFAGDGALPSIVACLDKHVSDENYESCIGGYANPCIEVASQSDTSALMRINKLANCYVEERQAWETLTGRALQSWSETAPAGFANTLKSALAASREFQAVKCAIFEDMQRFGASGAILAASCRNEESARLAIFIGYKVD